MKIILVWVHNNYHYLSRQTATTIQTVGAIQRTPIASTVQNYTHVYLGNHLLIGILFFTFSTVQQLSQKVLTLSLTFCISDCNLTHKSLFTHLNLALKWC